MVGNAAAIDLPRRTLLTPVSSKASHAWAGSGSYGFRGEALVSIAALAIVEITSRQEGGETYTKVLKNGKTLFLGRSRHDLPRTRGTTVVVRELFNVVPVRQAALVANALPACRRTIETLALVNPQIRWTLREDRTGGAKQLLVVHGVCVRWLAHNRERQAATSSDHCMATPVLSRFKASEYLRATDESMGLSASREALPKGTSICVSCVYGRSHARH